MSNRRQYKRADYQRELQFSVDGGLGRVAAYDISEGGLRLAANAELAAAEMIKLFLPLPSNGEKTTMCMATAKPVWTSSTEVGLEFVDPSAETLIGISALLSH